MSSIAETTEADTCCANCGVAAVDDIKLEECTDCDLVKYCSEKCREDHREQHEEECNNRVKDLHDKKLFTQPDGTHLGECPLCFLPLSIKPAKSTFYSCCCNLICNGCEYANDMSNGGDNCPFCREPPPDDEEERRKRIMKRVKANDPVALREMGTKRYHEDDYDSAVKYWAEAAESGDAIAQYWLGYMYGQGWGVEEDEEKSVYHFEKAAIGGFPYARYMLGGLEEDGNIERAVKHFIIGANLGDELSMKALWAQYSKGNITKEDLDATLRTHQAAIDETKSAQRDAAETSGVFST